MFSAYLRKEGGRSQKKWEKRTSFFLLVSLQANIRDTFFDQKSPRHPEVGVLQRHRYTDRHGDSMTDPAQRAEAVKIDYVFFMVWLLYGQSEAMIG